MSTSEFSFSFCFWRFDMIENAMSSVSSGDNRGASDTVCSSPPIRITGNDPTFRCKSEAKWAVAVTNSSSSFTGIGDSSSRSFLKSFEVGQETERLGTSSEEAGTVFMITIGLKLRQRFYKVIAGLHAQINYLRYGSRPNPRQLLRLCQLMSGSATPISLHQSANSSREI